MIHHLSIAARDPAAVAAFYAAVLDGTAAPFPPNPGSYMAFGRDGHGTAVEVYPAGSVMEPGGDEGARFARRASDGRTATHFALSVDLPVTRIREMAADRGWACHDCDRGGHFRVVEVWVENDQLVELLPPDYAADYLAFASLFTRDADSDALMASHPSKLKQTEPA